MFFPFLYKHTRDEEIVTIKKFFAWLAFSVYQSIAIFVIPYIASFDFIMPDGKTFDLWTISSMSYFGLVHLHYLILFMITKNWTLFAACGILGSYMVFNPGFVFIYNTFENRFLTRRIEEVIYNNVHFWLISIISMVVSLLPYYFYYMV